MVIATEIPVALAGRGNFILKKNTGIISVDIIINVPPLNRKTFIFLATQKKHIKLFDSYISQYQNPLQIINMVESWMIHGTDHWFIKPSTWETIDKKYQDKMLNKILNKGYNCGFELEYSIFNKSKMTSINLMEENYDNLDELLVKLLDKEKNKLTFAHTRVKKT